TYSTSSASLPPYRCDYPSCFCLWSAADRPWTASPILLAGVHLSDTACEVSGATTGPRRDGPGPLAYVCDSRHVRSLTTVEGLTDELVAQCLLRRAAFTKLP